MKDVNFFIKGLLDRIGTWTLKSIKNRIDAKVNEFVFNY